MKKREFLAAMGGLSIAPFVRAKSGQIQLKLAHAGPDDSSQHLAATEFARLVKDRTSGQVNVRIYHSGQLGNDSIVIGGVRGGTIDMMIAGSGNFTGLSPKMGALDLPFLFRDIDHAHKVLDSDIGNELLNDLQKYQLMGLGWFEIGFRCITTRNKVVQVPDDLHGLKIRTLASAYQILTFKLLKANPVPMPIGELYQALESGAVDAQEHPLSLAWSAKFYEVQKHLTLSRHAYTGMPIVMNLKKFKSMDDGLQKAILSSAKDASLYQRDFNKKDESKLIQNFKDYGIAVVENFNAEPFKKIVVNPSRKDFIEQYGTSLLDSIDNT